MNKIPFLHIRNWSEIGLLEDCIGYERTLLRQDLFDVELLQRLSANEELVHARLVLQNLLHELHVLQHDINRDRGWWECTFAVGRVRRQLAGRYTDIRDRRRQTMLDLNME